MSRSHELAWAAGFFDGEGYVTIGKRKSVVNGKIYESLYLRVGINHVAPEPLTKMHELFGGAIEYTAKVAGNRKPRYRWVVNTKKAQEVLVQLLPYMRNKNKVAVLGIEFQNCMASTKTKLTPEQVDVRDKYRVELMRLNAND